MALEIRQIHCPNCGAPLDIHNVRRSKTAVCGSCGSQLDLTDPQYRVLSDFSNVEADPRTPIELGMVANLLGGQWQAIGRIRYREEGAFWDEWLLMSEEGEFLWLTEGEEGWTLYDPVVPQQPPDPNAVEDEIAVDGQTYPVRTHGTGTIDYIEGELTWKAVRGEPVRYIDAQRGLTKFSIEWTPSEIEYFRGEKMAANTVRQAFGLPALAVSKGGSRLVGILVLVLVIICVCGFLALFAAPSDGDDNSGGGIGFIPGIGSGSGGSSSGGTRGGGGSGSSSGGGGK
ncbi:MAG: DUF4178 domain-containing protein [Dehalococcoidia bacterium]